MLEGNIHTLLGGSDEWVDAYRPLMMMSAEVLNVRDADHSDMGYCSVLVNGVTIRHTMYRLTR